MRLILVGFGTVGRGAAECLIAATPEFVRRGLEARVVAVVDPVVGSVARPAGLDLERLLRMADDGEPLDRHPDAESVDDPGALFDADVADVLVELTPTNLTTGEPGLGHVRAALAAGLHVATTNKGPIALAYPELEGMARAAGVALRFEGTVMSGTPVLSLCEQGLSGAGLRGVRGVLNGTCNFMLSRMEEGAGYDDALEEAQRHGYAEADPSGDVDGWDAAAKALILANCVLGADLRLDDVERRGIGDITAEAVRAALDAGETWRLVARVERGDNGWRAAVRPEMVPRSSPLGALTGPGNMLVFETDALGEVVISGPGAGRRATGHAVLADLLAIAGHGAG